jgi:ribosomal protein S27AE
MGHYVNFTVMPANAKANEMEAWRISQIDVNQDRLENPSTDWVPPLHVLDNDIIDGYENARDFLDEYAMRDGLGYTDAAVRFRDHRYTDDVKKSSKLRTLEERLDYLTELKRKTHDEALPSRRSGKRTTCTKCGSALANAFLNERDHCPVCGQTLLSPTSIKRLDSIDARLKRCTAELKDENDKLSKKAAEMWLVRASCHC